MPFLLLFIVFIVVPLVELYVIIQVGGAIGIPATIVMPKLTPFLKVEKTTQFGARVLLEGDSVDEAAAFAHRLAAERGLTFIHPYDDPQIIAGQGTVGLEMLTDAPELDGAVRVGRA